MHTVERVLKLMQLSSEYKEEVCEFRVQVRLAHWATKTATYLQRFSGQGRQSVPCGKCLAASNATWQSEHQAAGIDIELKVPVARWHVISSWPSLCLALGFVSVIKLRRGSKSDPR